MNMSVRREQACLMSSKCALIPSPGTPGEG